jgi:transcriptional antiterminator RfaH
MSSIAARALAKIASPNHRPTGAAWHVFYTEPRAELRVRWTIAALGFEAYVPTYRVEIRHGRQGHRGIKTRVEHRPAFTRYVFARFDAGGDEWGAISSVKGVLHPVSNNGEPCRIPDALVDDVKRLEAIGFFDQTSAAKARFVPGETVRVSEGAFTGLNGDFVADHGKSVEVLMKMLGGAYPVKLPLEYLEKV